MSSLSVSAIILACILAGIIVGMMLRAILSEKHLTAESKDLIKLAMGLIGTMTALVLGLLIASAKNSYDVQRNGLSQMAGNIVFLDRTLAHYGPESKDARELLRVSVIDMVQQTWPAENQGSSPTESKAATEGRYEGLYEKIQELPAKNDVQRALQNQAVRIATDIAQARWLLFAQKGRSIPTPFLVVMVSWLAILLGSFALFAPPRPIVVVVLLISAVAVSSAIFLVLELDRPFDGIINIPSAPVRSALAQLGR